MIEIIACLTLLQIFHQCFPCDTDTSWCTGGTGGVLQVNQTVFCGIYNDIFPFVRCQTVSICLLYTSEKVEEAAKETVEKATEKATETVAEVKETAKETAEKATEATKETAETAKATVKKRCV